LPHTQADLIASTIPEPTSATSSVSARETPGTAATGGSVSAAGRTAATGSGSGQDFDFAEEDMELQAALQASLMGGVADELLVPEPGQPRVEPAPQTTYGLPTGAVFGAGEAPRGRFAAPLIEDDDDEDAEDTDYMPPGAFQAQAQARARATEAAQAEIEAPMDPVAASMARNRALLDRMRAEQEEMLRDQRYHAEVARLLNPGRDTRAREQPDEGDEDEMLRRAIAESRALRPPADEDEDAMDESDDPPVRVPEPRTPTAFAQQHRVYDDDDAELQAALRASLEDAPPGFIHSESPTNPPGPPPPQPGTVPRAQGSVLQPAPPAGLQRQPSAASIASTYETESEVGEEPPPPTLQETVEEMRKKRLARFGG
jgi:ataxin-3